MATTNQLLCCLGETTSNCGDATPGSGLCETVLTQYCNNSIFSDVFCQTTFKTTYPSDYKGVMTSNCFHKDDTGTYPYIANPSCVEFMSNNESISEQYLKDFCKDKIGNSKYDNICGCFYPTSEYSPSQLTNLPCNYPLCSQATVIPKHATCPKVVPGQKKKYDMSTTMTIAFMLILLVAVIALSD
jgi:hypothetical protein